MVQFLCFLKGVVDVGTDVLFAQQTDEAVALQYFMYFFVYSGEDDCDATLVRHLDEVLQVVHTGGIDEWYATHTDDADTRALAHTIHDIFEFASHSKEVRSVDFVNFHVFWNSDVFDIRIVDVSSASVAPGIISSK